MSARVRASLAATLVAVLSILLLPGATIAAAPPGIDRFMAAVGKVESGGNYYAENPTSGAYGKYQILPSNWPAWAEIYLGDRNAKPTPQNQEIVARGKFTDLYEWLGAWRQVAYWWLTGRDGRSGSWSSAATTYVNKVMTYYYASADTQGTTTDRKVIGDAYASVHYTGRWNLASHGSYVGGQVHYSIMRGATASLTFSGRTISWYGPTGPTRGRARVLIDGKAVATVDLRASTFHPKELVYSKRFASTGKHTITIVVLATAGRPNVSIDAFVVRG